jgi:hypothetical protein
MLQRHRLFWSELSRSRHSRHALGNSRTRGFAVARADNKGRENEKVWNGCLESIGCNFGVYRKRNACSRMRRRWRRWQLDADSFCGNAISYGGEQ